MSYFRRSDNSQLAQWYFQIDRSLLVAVFILIAVGILTMISAGPYAARRIGAPTFFFLHKFILPCIVGICAMFFFSFLNKKWIKILSVAGVAVCLILLIGTMIMPTTIKGSKRWLNVGFMMLQPSEILKPFWIIVSAMFFSWMQKKSPGAFFAPILKNPALGRAWLLFGSIFLLILLILLRQPDLGMTMIYMAMFGSMLFLAGTSKKSVGVVMAGVGAVFAIAFLTLSHVRHRTLSFFGVSGATADNYQITQALDSIRHGGLFGQAGDGFIKTYLPDSHTDFVLATLVEDWGVLVGIIILGIYFYIIWKILSHMRNIQDSTTIIAVGGIATLFGCQTIVNVATTLHLIPPKGMTLPFISYGGTSFISFCILFGILLALLRADRQDFINKKPGDENDSIWN